MAQRRMTSLDVIDTDAFLDMPQSAQLLYFHLNARADDDGFIANPKRVMRDIGSQGDDIKLLVMKKFIISFEDGVVVIKHWRINNYIRKDIYTETKYLNHKQTLYIRPNGSYSLNSSGVAIPVPSGHFQLDTLISENVEKQGENHVHVTSTSRALRIGKVRIGKVSIGKDKEYPEDFEEFWKIYPKHTAKKNAFVEWKKITAEDRAAIMLDVPKRKLDDKWVNGFVKDPERYIKNRQWEDDIIPPRKKPGALGIQATPGKYANIKTIKINV